MTSERPKPYIGVSGVIRGHQDSITNHFESLQLDEPPHSRRLALGVKAVHKTQWLDIENKYGRQWYPVGEPDFAASLEPHGDSLRVAQVYLDTQYIRKSAYRTAFINRIAERGKSWLNAIQFDMLPFTDNYELLPFIEKVKHETGHAILLQAHSGSMEQLGPDGITTLLGRYAHTLDYILFDASHGRGITLEPDSLKPFLEASYASDSLSSVGIAVAGGLSAKTVRDELAPIVAEYSDTSWDAEGQLHPGGPEHERPLDMQQVNEYLDASLEILEQG